MKKLILLFMSIIYSLTSAALNPNIQDGNTITNFTQLVRAVESGHNVRAVIFFDRCQIQNQNENLQLEIIRRLEDASTRFNFNTFYHAKERIDNDLRDTVSTTMKVYFEHPSTGEIWTLFGRLRVYEDNRSTLRLVFINPITHKRELILEWLCDINNNFTNNLNNANNINNNDRNDRGVVLYDGF